MAGIPTVPDTTGRQVIDSLALGRSTGTTAQSWAGPTMEAGNSPLENTSAQQAPGQPTPADARPGYANAGQPGGNSASSLVPGGQYDTDNQIQDVSAPAGTAGGAGQYPGPVNPMVSPGWTVQTQAANDYEQLVITTASPLPNATHSQAYSEQLVASGGDGSNTWSLESGSLPSPCTLSSSGLISGTPTATGSATFEVKVVDTHGNNAQKIFTVTVN
jgi:hypothetical protein